MTSEEQKDKRASWEQGVRDCIRIVKLRIAHYEVYRDCEAMKTRPPVFATLDEVLVSLEAMLSRGKYASISELMMDKDTLWDRPVEPEVSARSPIEYAAKCAVDNIVEDLRDRRGLKSEWNQIDEDVVNEIETTWRNIVEVQMLAWIERNDAEITAK